jgi:hypothetical protein
MCFASILHIVMYTSPPYIGVLSYPYASLLYTCCTLSLLEGWCRYGFKPGNGNKYDPNLEHRSSNRSGVCTGQLPPPEMGEGRGAYKGRFFEK